MAEEDTSDLPGNFRWFDDAHRLAGCALPFLREDVHGLKHHGITAVVSLIPDDEFPNKEEFMRAVEDEGLGHHRVEIPNFGAPTQEQISDFLDFVTAEMKKGRVVIHCVGGKGRTGTMAGICLLSQGMPFEKMKARITYVESEVQRNALIEFAVSRRHEQTPDSLARQELENLSAGLVDLKWHRPPKPQFGANVRRG